LIPDIKSTTAPSFSQSPFDQFSARPTRGNDNMATRGARRRKVARPGGLFLLGAPPPPPPMVWGSGCNFPAKQHCGHRLAQPISNGQPQPRPWAGQVSPSVSSTASGCRAGCRESALLRHWPAGRIRNTSCQTIDILVPGINRHLTTAFRRAPLGRGQSAPAYSGHHGHFHRPFNCRPAHQFSSLRGRRRGSDCFETFHASGDVALCF